MMRMSREETQRSIIAEQAAQWLCNLREADEAQQQQFLAWLKQSPRHVKEFLFADTVWREVEQARFVALDLNALIGEARANQNSVNVIPLANEDAETPKQIRPARHRWLALAAGTALIAVGASLTAWWMMRAPDYSTTIGEQRSLRLDDGSLLQLNTHSRVEVHYSERVRELRLVEGEALFTVQRDAMRPFLVHAGNTVIQVLGTQFNVYRRPEGTTVAVISGAVQVIADQKPPLRLDAGQEVRIAKSGKLLQTQSEVSDALAWRERRLVFRGETLDAVAAEFNRYNKRQFRVEGESAKQKLLSGTFDADDPDSLVLFLRRLSDLAVESNEDRLLIRAR